MQTRKIMLNSMVAMTMILSVGGCFQKKPRIEPGKLEITKNTTIHTGKIKNIIVLSEKEVSASTEVLAGLTGALVGGAVGEAVGENDTVKIVIAFFGIDAGEKIVKDKYGTTIYKLTIELDNEQLKEVYAKGGTYSLNRDVKVSIDKKSGNITSFVLVSKDI